MKTFIKILAIATALCAGSFTLNAAGKKIETGPRGGRLLDKTSPAAEFFVERDRTVSIAFYDAKQKPIPATDQSVTIIADARDGKTSLEFEKKGDTLVSKTKLPEGDSYNLVVQFRQTADAKPQNFRFKLDLHTCGGCKHSEYACSCNH